VNDRAIRAPRRYDATLDRVGLALGVGSALGGLVAMLLLLAGGTTRDPLALTAMWMMGSLFVGIGITAVAGPLWLVMHVAGLRRARHAALVGAVTALAIFVGAQTYGFGLIDVPVIDSRTWMYRWISAVLTSLLLAVLAAGIGVVMWRIAYRQQREG
jgi:MFS family permease